jgi:hypothetical protein
MPAINFNAVDPRLPGSLRWKIARHEQSSYDRDLQLAADKRAAQVAYAEAALQYAVKTKDGELARAVMSWARAKQLITEAQ